MSPEAALEELFAELYAADKKTNLARAVMSYDFDRAEDILQNSADPNAVTTFHQDIIWFLMRQNSDGNRRMTELIEGSIQ